MIKKIAKSVLPDKILTERARDLRKETHINRALSNLNGQTYVEIGVKNGDCFRQITATRKIGIDPVRHRFGHELGPGEQYFEMTSDTFFANHAEELFRHQCIDVALVDGLHEFSQALRDVLNLENFMSPQGVIFIHDCNPPTRKHVEVDDGGVWTGDVWKVAYYLTTYRHDLSFFTINCDWGLGILTGFNSDSSVQPPLLDILKVCGQLDYELLENKRKHILRLRTPYYSRLFFKFVHPHRSKRARPD